MEPAESQQPEALAVQVLLQHYSSPVLRGLAQMLWDRAVSGYPIGATASESGVRDMSVVIATVASIDANSVCEDPNCAQRGELYRDHTVVHKAKGAKKGLRGVCPECEGPLHNLKDDAKLIAFACLWRQQYGSDARKTPVNALTLAEVVRSIQTGKITKWADRSLMLTVLGGAAPVPKGVAATSAVGSTSAPARPSPSTPSTATAASSTSTQAVQSPVPTQKASLSGTKSDSKPDPDKQRKLRELLKSAKVTP